MGKVKLKSLTYPKISFLDHRDRFIMGGNAIIPANPGPEVRAGEGSRSLKLFLSQAVWMPASAGMTNYQTVVIGRVGET